MRSKLAIVIVLSVLGGIFGQGCSGGSSDSKAGVKIQPGDYVNAPGGGAKPPAAPGASN